MIATPRVLTRTTVAGYAAGSLGTGGFATLPGLVLVFYLTDTLGVAALMAGLLVTLAKVWDVIIDPLIGAWSDRWLLRTGSRRGFMLLGACTLPLFFVITFSVPAGIPPLAAGIWVFVAFLLTATSFSLFQVPYIALPAEIADTYDQRTRLLTWRVVVLTLAILLFGAGGPALRSVTDDEYVGYIVMAVVAGVVIGLGMLVAVFVSVPRRGRGQAVTTQTPTPTDAASGAAPDKVSLRRYYAEGFGALRRSQPFRALLATFLLQGLATGMMLAAANYVAVWVLHSDDALTFLFIALIAPALVFAPLWGAIARRIGKERSYVYASTLYGIAALSLIGMLWAPSGWVYLPVALAGAGYAGMQSLPMAMLPDVISHDAVTAGPGRAGTFGGMWTAGETTGMALGATALSVVLAVTGYVQSAGAEVVTQPASAVAGIVVSFSVVPAVIILASILTLRGYRLRRGDIDLLRSSSSDELAPQTGQ
ncbi:MULTISPECIES: MFS transporter [unclassified Leifsonia]|uniref:MFS transporter n=1 Tax=unclassified Leifsonia TaxID=2663824 RepID=UPI0006FD7200|nr:MULTISPECIES: MFS transporter [unclassified Leifsonia]KQX07395.1 MFS transporter [Leifsonia sp. Root1293]KRA11677.1 MFS transporter [Leifsonia sp. Root60]